MYKKAKVAWHKHLKKARKAKELALAAKGPHASMSRAPAPKPAPAARRQTQHPTQPQA